ALAHTVIYTLSLHDALPILARRDLTINAIAKASDGSLVDPYGGQRDLREKRLRHVSPAFAEDPVRILRIARFAARFSDFTLAPRSEEHTSELQSLRHLVCRL